MVWKRIASPSRAAAACSSSATRGAAATSICREARVNTLNSSTPARTAIAPMMINAKLRINRSVRRIIFSVSRTRCSVLHAAAQSRDRNKHRRLLRPRLCSAPLRKSYALRCVRGTGVLFGVRAGDAFEDQLVGVFGVSPAQHLHPLALFQVLVVLEKMLDLLQRDFRQVAIGLHLVVALRQL